MSHHSGGPTQKSRFVEEPALIFRFNDEAGSGADVIRDVLLDRGMIEYKPGVHKEYDWNLWWKNSRFRQSTYSQLKPWQRLNHHPNSKGCFNDITIKDGLLRNMRRMKGIYNSVFDYTPETFHLPREERLFKETFRQFAEDADKRRDNYWIYKPSDSSRGRGIFVVNQLCDFRYGTKAIVQHYISRPFLICGYKFDLRLYVVVVSYRPLIIYVLKDGLARFSTEKFDLSDLDNVYSHLTNSSINKNGPSYTTKKIGIGSGCKWSFKQLRYYLYQNDIEDRKLWSEISAIVILTILSQASSVPSSCNCFELFGFDIIFDHNLKPWLLEVNFSPAMSLDCSVDIQVKRSLINSICDLLGFSESDAIGYNRFHCIYHSNVSSNYNFSKESWQRRRPKTQGSERYSAASRLSRKSHQSPDLDSTTDSGLSSSSSLSRNHSKCRLGDKEHPGTSMIDCSSGGLNSSQKLYQTTTISGGMFNIERARMRRHERQSCGDVPQLNSIAEDNNDSDTDSVNWNSGPQPYRLPSLTNSLSDIRQKSKSSSSNRSTLFSGNKKSRKRPKTSASSSLVNPRVSHQFDTESRHLEQKEMINRYCRMVSGENDPPSPLFSRSNNRLYNDEYSEDHSDSELGPKPGKPNSRASRPDEHSKLRSTTTNPMYGPKSIRLHTSHCLQLPALPESFGDLQLLFPFNETSRRAASQLEEKSIVRETVRLLRHRAKEMQLGESIFDPNVIDIPEAWPPL